jgi:hypothetical protein
VNVVSNSSGCPAGFETPAGSVSGTSCNALTPFSNKYAYVSAPTLSASACAPKLIQAVAEPVWQIAARACVGGSASGACGNGELCVPKPADGWKLCVYQSGSAVCPAGYPEKQFLYDGLVDNRTCSACTCGAPQGSCTGYTWLFTATQCNFLSAPYQKVEFLTCTGPLSAASAKLEATGSASCAPGTSIVQGALELQNPRTFCCAP